MDWSFLSSLLGSYPGPSPEAGPSAPGTVPIMSPPMPMPRMGPGSGGGGPMAGVPVPPEGAPPTIAAPTNPMTLAGPAGGAGPGGPSGPLPAVPGSSPPAGAGYGGGPGPSIGESLEPTKPAGEEIPLPRPRPAGLGGPVATSDTSGSVAANPIDKVAAMLRGVQTPARPDVVKPSTPHGPPVQHIQGGSFAALMHALYPQLAMEANPAPPTTLGASVHGVTGRL